MNDPRDLEADLAILTCIPFDPNDVNMISDIVAPHAIRRAIAAEKRVVELESELNIFKEIWKAKLSNPASDSISLTK